MLQGYEPLLAACEPYVAAVPDTLARCRQAPLGLDLRAILHVDPTRSANGPFFDRMEHLDNLVDHIRSLATPRWAAYDCGLVPGIAAGFTVAASALRPLVACALGARPGSRERVPISTAVAIPTAAGDSWLLHTLTVASDPIPDAAPPGLAAATLALAAAMVPTPWLLAAAQWRSRELQVHALFGPAEVLAAWVPAHGIPATAVVRYSVATDRLSRGLSAGTEARVVQATEEVDVSNTAALQALQVRIEGGARLWLVGPPRRVGATLLAPLADTFVGGAQ